MALDARRAFWRQYRTRQSGKGRGGVAYAVYVGALLVLIYGAPLMRTVGVAVHDDDVVARLVDPGTAHLLSTVLGGAIVAAFVVGTSRGPAVVRPFVAHALATAPISRRRAFGGAVLRSGLAVGAVAVAGSLVLLVPLADAGAMTWAAAAVGLAATALFAVLAVAAWLAGQAATGAAVWAVPVALIGVVGAGAALPDVAVTPWAWAAAPWPQGEPLDAWAPVALLGATALIAAAMIPVLLGRLTGPGIVDQSRRWEGATSAALTGDVNLAMGSFRAAPAVGRRWRVVGGSRYATAVLRADLVATLRTPLRTLVAVLALTGGGFVLAAAGEAPGFLRPALAVVASILVFAGLGPLADGLRHAVLAISGPRLFGLSDAAMVASRAGAPLLGGDLVVGAAAALQALVAGTPGLPALVTSLLLVALLTLVRLSMASKGTPPLWLSVPVATPVGDLSVVGTALWQLDGVIVSAIAGVAVLSAVDGSSVGALVVTVLAGIQVLQWRARMAKHQ